MEPHGQVPFRDVCLTAAGSGNAGQARPSPGDTAGQAYNASQFECEGVLISVVPESSTGILAGTLVAG